MAGWRDRICPGCSWQVMMIRKSKTLLRCPMCAKIIEITDGEKEGLAYLLETWYKLRKYNMKSTGVESTDTSVRQEYGDWLINSKPYLP